MSARHVAAAVAAAWLLAGACAGPVAPAAGAAAAAPVAPRVATYTLALIRTGARSQPLDAAARREVFRGHFANMGRLARAGQLVLAGPYGQHKHADDLRGLFVLDTADRAAAQQWAETDPGFLATEFRFEFHTLRTAAQLRAQLAADLAREDAIQASGRTPAPGEGGRGYVLLTASDGAAAAAVLAGHSAVLLCGELDDRQAFVVLDATTKVAAGALLAPLAPRLGEYQLDEWFASGLLVDLPRR